MTLRDLVRILKAVFTDRCNGKLARTLGYEDFEYIISLGITTSQVIIFREIMTGAGN